jgi:hypothetical protein
MIYGIKIRPTVMPK